MFFDVYYSLCEMKNKTPNGVAKELGFSSASVTQWKHGSTPRPLALQKIADYFGVSVNYLLGDKENSIVNTADVANNEVMRLYNLLPKEEQEAYLNYLQTRVNILGLNNDGK